MMNEEIRIVPTEEQYVEACADIAVRAWKPIYESFKNSVGEKIYNELWAEWPKKKVEYTREMHATGNAFVALQGDRVVGYVSYLLKGNVGQIVGNAVDPDMHGHGISKLLYTAALNKFREEGCKYARVNTGLDDSHAPARRAYNKVGFEKNLPSIMYYQELDLDAEPYPTSSDTVQVIPCEEQHLDDCARITLTAWSIIHESYKKCIGEKMHDDLYAGWEESTVNAVLAAQRSGRGYVAIVDGKVAGFAAYRTTGKFGVIGRNAVDPAYRGRGIAKLMYGMLINKMREEGCLYAQVHTGLDEGHTGARKAYGKIGFERNLPEISYFMEL